MKTNVKLTATNSQGAKVFFFGDSEEESMENFLAEYDKKGWIFSYEYFNEEEQP
ncbi:MAG: hypothetical protein WCI57_04250 [Candidatus Berkelbacteria bacterium]